MLVRSWWYTNAIAARWRSGKRAIALLTSAAVWVCCRSADGPPRGSICSGIWSVTISLRRNRSIHRLRATRKSHVRNFASGRHFCRHRHSLRKVSWATSSASAVSPSIRKENPATAFKCLSSNAVNTNRSPARRRDINASSESSDMDGSGCPSSVAISVICALVRT